MAYAQKQHFAQLDLQSLFKHYADTFALPDMNNDKESTMIEWARTNLDHGCSPDEMLKSMLSSGWGWRDAHRFLDAAHSDANASGSFCPSIHSFVHRGQNAPDGARIRTIMKVSDPEVALLQGFLTPEESQRLIAMGQARLARSTTVALDSGGEAVHRDRSSSGAYLHDSKDPIVATARARASWAFQCPESHIEGLQILRYLPGEEYKPHHDWFDPATPGGARQLLRGGQRIATAIVYLNDCSAGGSTAIPALGASFTPVSGNALFFAYPCDKDSRGDARLLHAGEPVESGEKWICTFWMRQFAHV
jgi:prolyl 4-hydroxylase